MSSETVSTAAQQIVLPNRLRKSLVIQNEDTAINVFVKLEQGTALTVSATDHDHLLGPGASIAFALQSDGDEQTKGRWTAIAASGTPRVSTFETEDVRR